MTPNVVQIVQGALTPEVTAGAAERLGEQSGAVATALAAAVPAVFALLGRRGGEAGGPEALLAAIRSGGVAFSLNDPLARLRPEEAAVLGEDAPALGRRVADFAGVGADAGEALVGMATPLALGALARTAPPPLNAETLGRTLREQANNIDRALPPGFTLGAPDVVPTPAPAPPAVPSEVQQAEVADRAAAFAGPQPIPAAQPPAATKPAPAASGESGGAPKWALLLLAVLVLLAVAFVVMRVTDGRVLGPAPAARPAPADAGPAPPGS